MDISKIELVIIENGARWLVENFVLSCYDARAKHVQARVFWNEK